MEEEIINYLSNLFSGVDQARTFLIDNRILLEHRPCNKPGCTGVSRLAVIVTNENSRIIYRCNKKGCQKRESVLNTKMELHKYLFLLYLIFINLHYFQIKCLLNVCDTTIARAKEKLRAACCTMIERTPMFLGGDNMRLQVDETVLCRNGIIRDPSNTDDDTPNTVWIFGGIDASGNFFVQRVQNRRTSTLTNVLEPITRVNTILVSDGYPSYPRVARNLSLRHEVVNHSEGFINEDGTHTNGAEGLWSVMKGEMRRQNGVKREDIDEWLIMFTFRRRFLRGYNPRNTTSIFIQILSIMFLQHQ